MAEVSTGRGASGLPGMGFPAARAEKFELHRTRGECAPLAADAAVKTQLLELQGQDSVGVRGLGGRSGWGVSDKTNESCLKSFRPQCSRGRDSKRKGVMRPEGGGL